jgi:hypothetical protein
MNILHEGCDVDPEEHKPISGEKKWCIQSIVFGQD